MSVYTVNVSSNQAAVTVTTGLHDVVWGGGDTIGWYENDGGGSANTSSAGNTAARAFRPSFSGAMHQIACNGTGVRKVVASDIDNDTHVDVLGMLYWGDRLVWYRNSKNGDGGFGSEHLVASKLQGIRDAIVADLNGDGIVDIATVRHCKLWVVST